MVVWPFTVVSMVIPSSHFQDEKSSGCSVVRSSIRGRSIFQLMRNACIEFSLLMIKYLYCTIKGPSPQATSRQTQ